MLRLRSFVVFIASHMMYSLVHSVIWSFILTMCHFSHEYVLHILCWCLLCFRYETSFHLYIMITLAWPIMEDIEPIDLGSGDRPREFETVTHFFFWLERVPYPYSYFDFVDLVTYPFWAWHDTIPWYHYTTLPPLFVLSCYSTIAFPFHHFLDLTR